jgi:hypothetical protein
LDESQRSLLPLRADIVAFQRRDGQKIFVSNLVSWLLNLLKKAKTSVSLA